MPKTMGLDLSLLATGVCVLDGDTEVRSMRCLLMKRDSTSGVLESIERLISIAEDIIKIASDENPSAIIIEAPAKNQVWQAANIGELHGVVKVKIFEELGIVPFVEQATKMRKAVVGSISSKREKIKKNGKDVSRVSYGLVPGKKGGKYKRATVKDIVELRLKERGLEFKSQDEMDAYVAAKYGFNLIR